jgi:hypothetical protein
MKDHKYHGSGKLKTQRFIQTGLFRDNRFVHGKVDFTDGSKYEGSVENGGKAGKGYFMARDGTEYNGYFLHDKLNGAGEVKYRDGSTYRGNFMDG